ncbi:hypothetical protein F4777DRAFT_558239 [Nemania sp. FL0916]|nr:hypothetical protein F4777DRAFT_558239 [Nemania sp. FL0916]
MMSHRQSCDRCRQQKVKCRRYEPLGGKSNPSLAQSPLAPCERCTKAEVGCVYSLKQRSNSRSIPASARRDTDPGAGNMSGNGTSWLEQGLAEVLYPGRQYLGSDVAHLVGQFHGIDEDGTAAGFNGWDAQLQLPPFSPVSLNSLVAPSATDAADALPFSTAPSTTDGQDDSDDGEDDKDPPEGLSSQLTSLSQRTAQAVRRLVRPGRGPLTVASPEVSEALEDTNILIRIINNIASRDHDDATLDPSTTNYGLAFSALACHQHLVALFRAICDAIHQCIQSKKEELQQQQQYHRTQQHSDVGPSSVAQFVMVLQLLMHLINRIDRSLFQNNPTMWHCATFSSNGHITPSTPDIADHHSIDPILSAVTAESSSSSSSSSSAQGGLLVLVHDIMGTIPKEHEKLRQVIQNLQTEMEHSELH